MHRPRYLWCLVLVPVLAGLALSASGCAGYPEDQMVRKFFYSSRVKDTATVGNIATVSFDPSTDGQVESFSIVSVSPEQSHPLEIKAAAEAYREAQAADDAFNKRKKEYQDKNLDAIDRVLKAEPKGVKLRGRDAEVQAEWTKWRQETADYAKKSSAARNTLNAARRVADMSAPQTMDPTQFDGTEYSKEVNVQARVRTPDGQVVNKTLVLTMERVVLKGENGQDVPGKWMITRIQDAGAAK